MFEPAADIDQRHHRIAQLEELTPQRIEPLHLLCADRLMQDPVLQLLDFLAHRLDHRHVIVDDEIEDLVEDIVLAVRQRFRAGFAVLAHRRIGRRGPVPHRDDITVANEQMRLTESNLA